MREQRDNPSEQTMASDVQAAGDDMETFEEVSMMSREYGSLLKELQRPVASSDRPQPKQKPIFKITITTGDSDQMSDGEEDREEEMDDGPLFDGQDFIQEEYDFKLLVTAIVSRVYHKSIAKYTKNTGINADSNPFLDEFSFFTDNLRKIFNQKSVVLDEIIRQKL